MKIDVSSHGEICQLQVSPGAKLLDYLQANGISVNAACGGKGSCHKCRIRVEHGFLSVTSIDKLAFSENELSQGWRLSCQAHPRASLNVVIPFAESLSSAPRLIRSEAPVIRPLRAVCDLGSTGVVVALGNARGEVLLEAHALNSQIRFGADIMTRLHYAQERGTEPLRQALSTTLKKCFTVIEKAEPLLWAEAVLEPLYCAGNSAILSFLHGWDIKALAVSPFQPEHLAPAETLLEGVRLRSLPLLGGFVGADTVAGILYLENRDKLEREPWMLVDIGTNTEVVLKDQKGTLWYASAPAGPAFEGGNISQGMRAEPGAISSARYTTAWNFGVIGNDRARGICGSGLVDILSEAVNSGLIGRDGYIRGGRLDLSPDIALLADDVREFQLAKSATRTACEILFKRAGLRAEKIYLAGTFAQHLNLESVQRVGLLPPGIELEQVGNTSLLGTLLYALKSTEEQIELADSLVRMQKQVDLALQDDFQEAFVRHLDF